MSETIQEPARDIPVIGHYDVLVVGGGPAGVCAALSAARSGARTFLIEQFSCFGGMATAGLHQHIGVLMGEGGTPSIVGGIPYEIIDRAVREWEADSKGCETHAVDPEVRPGRMVDVEIEGFKCCLDLMIEEAGVDFVLCSQFSDAIVRDGAVAGVYLNNKSGRFAVLAERTIDCTGDGQVAFSAGCRMMRGRPEDERMQPVTLMYRVGGIDREAVPVYRGSDPKLIAFCRKAAEKGLMRPWQSRLMGFWYNRHRPDQAGLNFTHMHLDGADAFDLTRAAVEGRKQVQEAVHAMRTLIPGMENSYLIDTAVMMGVRETRRIFGEYVLTAEDIKAMKIFDDSIGLGSAFIDIHNTEGPGMDKKSGYHLPESGYYSIPYRTLVPESMNSLLVAGRCHSATHEAAGSTRWMAQCMVMGQAAGTAAALSVKEGLPPRKLDVAMLQETLRESGAILK